MSVKKPKFLVYDVEVLPNIGWFWQPGQQYVRPENILKERAICTAAWKWVGGKKVHSASILDDRKAMRENTHDDKVVITALHEAISGADVLIGHNSDAFDLKMFNARAIFHGLKPIPPKLSVDTLKQARKHFRFNSNKLDYIGKFLGLGEKIHTNMDLWLGVMRGEVKSIKEMLRYNRGDVELQEKVYLALRPYMANHPNMNALIDSPVAVCRSCGSDKLEWNGTRYTKSGAYKRYKCQSCYSWGQSVVNTLSHRPVTQ